MAGFRGFSAKVTLVAVMLLVISVPLHAEEPLSIAVAEVVEATSVRAANASAWALEVVESNQTLMHQFIEVAESKYSIGKGLQQDVLLAQLEHFQCQSDYGYGQS